VSFLDDYDQIPATDPGRKMALALEELRTNWRNWFKELRARRPVFQTPRFVFVTRRSDVLQTLSQHELFSVRPYRPSFDPSLGEHMLARDATEINYQDKAVMRAALRWEDLAGVRRLVGGVARESLAGARGKVELVSRVGRLVPLRIVQRYFGFAGPDDATMLRWSKATQWDMFHNPTNDQAIRAANVQAGQEMRTYLWQFLGEQWSRPEGGWPELPLARLTRMTRAGVAGMAASRVVTNVAGLLVGAIETIAQAIVQAVEQLLTRPDVLAAAVKAAQAGDDSTLAPMVWEALRFNPINTLVFRFTERETTLAPGAPHAVAVPAGTVVAVCTASAMFDDLTIPAPDEFRPDRPADTYLHFGLGHHECLGRYVATVAIPEAVRQVLLIPGLHRLPEAEGTIEFKNGPFPEQFFVGIGSSTP
jgi:cytochrome P450